MDVRRRFRVRQHLAPIPQHGLTSTFLPSPKPSPPYSLTILSSYVPPSQSCTHHLGALRAYDYPITLPAGDGNSVVSAISPSALASTSNHNLQSYQVTSPPQSQVRVSIVLTASHRLITHLPLVPSMYGKFSRWSTALESLLMNSLFLPSPLLFPSSFLSPPVSYFCNSLSSFYP